MTVDHSNWHFGAVAVDGGVRFRLWAPSAEPGLKLEVDGLSPITLTCDEEGYAQTEVPNIGPGTRYHYRLGDGRAVPDPASHLQADDVDGDSVVTDPDDYAWQHPEWRGKPWEDAVIYEVHVGLAGGFSGLLARLPELATLGVTVLELMPVNDFAGSRGWGYDGVLPYAPNTAYGTPAELKALVDTAHGLGMCVMLDVVYNHFGPSGNFLSSYAASFFREDIATPWGAAIDFRQTAVRDFFEENARYWLTEYKIDGLRLDAVHAIESRDWLCALPQRLRARLAADRIVHLVVEDELNRAYLLESGYDAQWDDDMHHVMHYLLTGEHQGYYVDYAEQATEQLARCLTEGWAYQGEPSAYRDGKPRGEPSGKLPPSAFIFFLQNHDQIGNRARGERLTQLVPNPDLRQAAISLQLLAPQIPLIFMGEEQGSEQSFLYFTDFKDAALAQAVRDGRRREFSRFAEFRDEAMHLPDPNALSTFEDSRPWINAPASRHWVLYYQELLTLRRTRLAPRLRGAYAVGTQVLGTGAVRADWILGDGTHLRVYTNLSDQSYSLHGGSFSPEDWQVLFQTPADTSRHIAQDILPPHCTVWLIDEA